MKRFYLQLIVMFSLVTGVFGQTTSLNKKQIPAYPVFNLISLDSATIFSTDKIVQNKPVVFLFFSTTCEHCQNEMKDLLKHKEDFTKIQLLLISTENLSEIKNFFNEYSLAKIPGMRIGKDYKYAGIKHFMFERFPFCAIYSKNRQFIKSFESEFDTDLILKELKKRKEI